jgi:hypothetical protein
MMVALRMKPIRFHPIVSWQKRATARKPFSIGGT